MSYPVYTKETSIRYPQHTKELDTPIKTYVPTEETECPEGVSIAIKEIDCHRIIHEWYALYINIENNYSGGVRLWISKN